MIELLISAVVASMIITPILFFVVDVLRTDTREEITARSEQELQAAADFIRRDLSQAIYIYDGEGVNAIRSQLPDSDNVVLVFWKQEFREGVIPHGDVPRPVAANHCDTRRCDDVQVLSLVAYYLQTEREPNSPWSDQARISRLQINDGVIDPNPEDECTQPPCYVKLGDKEFKPDRGFDRPPGRTSMNAWEAKEGEQIEASREVLIDYIDKTELTGDIDCESRGISNDDSEDLLSVGKNSEGNPIYGFFVCVDSRNTAALVNLRMNAAIRIDPNATEFDEDRRSLFPETSFLVKGLGVFN
ncbi:prepilin-type cleavage/methylation-like [Limnospira indica PCC 8005]|uniref:Prepilin-type cleavage/methylation-like n=2 Tax=Limnospira TaxID=2596745 RepID=A0A9P1KET6_9CYAN|nr:prepilin-type cleavage/methylation-like [Limnospira indica PCC 8005]